MFPLLGVLIIIISLICPLIGIIISAPISFFYHKSNLFIMLIFIVSLGYVGYFYAPRPIDDMSRYIIYMQSINASSAMQFIYQLYSAPFSIQGLNGAQWPGSGLILYLVSRYSNYRVLSAFTLAITYGSRLLVVKQNYLDAKVRKPLKSVIWLLAIFVTLQPYLALSGFRWYLSISLLMIISYFEMKNGFRLSFFWLYLLAASLHPAAFIFMILRMLSLLVSRKSNEKRLAVVTVILLFVVGIVEHSKVLSVARLFLNDFLAYTQSSTSLRRIDNFIYFIILGSILLTIIKLRRDKKNTSILNYLLLLVIFNMMLIDFNAFSRFIQFTIPMSVIVLSRISFSKDKWCWWELIISSSILILGIVNLIVVHYASFPPLLIPLKDILLKPM